MTHRSQATISSLKGAQFKTEVDFNNLCQLLDAENTFPEVEICTTNCGACVDGNCAMDSQRAPIGRPCRYSNKESF